VTIRRETQWGRGLRFCSSIRGDNPYDFNVSHVKEQSYTVQHYETIGTAMGTWGVGSVYNTTKIITSPPRSHGGHASRRLQDKWSYSGAPHFVASRVRVKPYVAPSYVQNITITVYLNCNLHKLNATLTRGQGAVPQIEQKKIRPWVGFLLPRVMDIEVER